MMAEDVIKIKTAIFFIFPSSFPPSILAQETASAMPAKKNSGDRGQMFYNHMILYYFIKVWFSLLERAQINFLLQPLAKWQINPANFSGAGIFVKN
jgi:hypothetical protein